MIETIINTSVATGIAEIVTLPICTVKTNYQVYKSNSIKETIISIYNKGGIRSFYTASAPFGQIISTTSKYTFYEYFRKNDHEKLTSGIASGILSSLITHPIDVYKVHRQLHKQMSIYNIYRGYTKSLSKVIVGSITYFPIYETIKTTTNYNPFICGALSATISTIIIHPIDYLKTTHMAGHKITINIYRGLLLNLVRIIPHFSIVMGINELIKTNIN